MGMTGSGGVDTLAKQLDDQLSTGRWPNEQQALLKLRRRGTPLGGLFHEAIEELGAYQNGLAAQFGLRPNGTPFKREGR